MKYQLLKSRKTGTFDPGTINPTSSLAETAEALIEEGRRLDSAFHDLNFLLEVVRRRLDELKLDGDDLARLWALVYFRDALTRVGDESRSLLAEVNSLFRHPAVREVIGGNLPVSADALQFAHEVTYLINFMDKLAAMTR